MADNSKIEWTDSTLTPIRARNRATGRVGHFCEHASPGCINCYSEAFNRRGIGAGVAFQRQNRDQVELFLDEKMLMQPLRWKRPRRIFWGSMTDLFADFVTDEWLDRIFAVAALTPQHTHLFLTKRTERMREYVAKSSRPNLIANSIDRSPALSGAAILTGAYDKLDEIDTWPLPNVWLGCSVEDQQRADERREPLSALAAAGWRTFVSYEPALGPVDWSGWEFLSQLISGGESGPKARPSHPDWHRGARDFCLWAGVAYFFKQWGNWHPDALLYTDLQGRNPPPNMRRSKKAAGRLLDGREWNEVPA
ncbi:MAG TPA: phage Gp37/Gp68 family protein [Stellaceae bacterium]|jgi:protein gp37|nr:phage Gp37/Gp68 family protein [Stellaceae bacterium]